MAVLRCTIKTESVVYFFFFNDTATTEIYTLSLHDALPIFRQCADLGAARGPEGGRLRVAACDRRRRGARRRVGHPRRPQSHRSEEHTSELQSRQYLVCRLLLEKKKKNTN